MSIAAPASLPIAASPPLHSGVANPWKGLHFYTEEDQDIFFGRGRETAEFLRLIRRDTLSVLFARSGLGKTSLLRAGVIPHLREEGFLPVMVRLNYAAPAPHPTRQIIDATRAAAAAASIDVEQAGGASLASYPEDRPATLWEFFHGHQFWSPRNDLVRPVLILDQFEEMFTLAWESSRTKGFYGELADLAENRMPPTVERRIETTGERLAFDTQTQGYRVVLSLREDFVPKLDLLREIMPAVMRNRFVLAPLRGEGAVEVVRRAGDEWVSEAVAREIVVAVAGKTGTLEQPVMAYAPGAEIEPAYLSVMCHELFRRMEELGRNEIGSDLVASEQGNILDAMYERSFKGLDPKTRLFVEDRLLTASGFRGTVPLADAQREGIPGTDLESLVDRRLLRFEDRLGATHVELSHDLLTRIAQKSRDQRQAEAKREAERQREEKYRVKLRRMRHRFLAGAATVVFLLGVLGFLYFGWVKTYQSYCREFTKRSGMIHPVGRLPRSAVAHRAWTLRLTRPGWFGKVQEVEVIDANGQPTPNHNITTYLADSGAAPSWREKESRYEFVYDREGRVVYEVAWNRFGQVSWGLAYSPHLEPAGGGVQTAKATFLGADGYPQPQGHSRAEFVEFSYDARGFEAELRYTDREGRSMPGPDRAYGRRLEYDKEGRLARLTSLNETGQPMNDTAGNAGMESKRDGDGNIIEGRAFDAVGKPTQLMAGFYRWTARYDEWGRKTEQRFFALSGEPAPETEQTNAHWITWKYDDRGNLLSTKLYDTGDQPIVGGEGIFAFPAHEQRSTFDPHNRVETVAYFDPDGKPMTRPEAGHGYRLEYDQHGFVSATSYFDGQGRPANLEALDVHRWEQVNDPIGQPIEERFFDSGRKPVAIRVGGYHLRKSEYDKAGNLVVQTYFDVAGHPVDDATDGAHRFVRRFDRFRNSVLTRYFDAAGRPVDNNEGFHRIASSYDEYGAEKGTRWYAKNGLPTLGPEGVHYVSYTYDKHGLPTRTVHLDGANHPATDRYGVYETFYQHNDKRQQTRLQNFAFNREPVNDQDGNHLVLHEFDSHGREVMVTQLCADGSPNWDGDLGIATRRQSYDRENRWTDQSYYDQENRLVTGPHGFAEGSVIYSADSRVELIHRGTDGRPMFNALVGFAIKKMDPRRRGDTVESYHGPGGERITGPEGYAEIRRHWGDDGTLLAEAWFGPDGSPVAGPAGYHRMAHTPGGPEGTTRYYDVRNRELPLLGPDTLVSTIFIAEITGIKEPAAGAGLHAGDILWRYGDWWFAKALAAERSKGAGPGPALRAVADTFAAERERLSAKSAVMTVIRNGKPVKVIVPPLPEKTLGVRLQDRTVPVATFEEWKRAGAG